MMWLILLGILTLLIITHQQFATFLINYILSQCSTLTSIDEPYPMLVLCGPRGSGKGYLSKHLVGDFPDFFGMGYVVAYLPDKHTLSHCF